MLKLLRDRQSGRKIDKKTIYEHIYLDQNSLIVLLGCCQLNCQMMPPLKFQKDTVERRSFGSRFTWWRL